MDTPTTEQTPGIGHNMPSAAAALQDRADQLAAACDAWLQQVQEIETEEQEKKAVDFVQRVKAEIKDAEEIRKAEKAPHSAAAAAVDATYNPIKAKLETIKNLFGPKLTAWMNKKEAARKEAERLAAEEAYRKIEEAEAAERAARKAAEQAAEPTKGNEAPADVVGTTMEAEAARKAAEQAVKDADRLRTTTTKAKGNYGDRAMSLRTVYSAEVTDYDALFEHFRGHPKVRDVLDQLADEWARSPDKRAFPLPGAKLKVEKKAA